ncbi:MAG: hypothetical protein DI586_07015 [Micavibrio aeruginosavorus]|uniref:Alpha/beta hydrolase n=1 Tax=Micavibrio aeruginosavorus TaxID=349221 RepID=A0A2W5HNQ0_9BACT|nr:MAG: hypothetical protein DI586_07015 [Micavibrio aeruginosavorus]
MKTLPDGRYTRSFDPGIAQEFKSQPLGHTDMWKDWDKIEQPVLAIRGELSLLFPVSIAKKMIERKTGGAMEFVTIADAGHVPSLYPNEQIKILADWI